MMKLYMAPGRHPDQAQSLIELAYLARNTYLFIANPDEADLILVIDVHYVYHHHRYLIQDYLHKAYAIENWDKPYFVLPGLFASASRIPLHPYRIRGCCYFSQRNLRSPLLAGKLLTEKPKYLFSFIGGSTSWVRKRLFTIDFKRPDVYVEASLEYNHWDISQPNREALQRRYIETIQRSKFALCPKGNGLGSIRLYEVMQLGVAPVIIADGWLPASGPNWGSFAVFVAESDIKSLPGILESYEPDYILRGKLAREAWEMYFSDEVLFDHYLSLLTELAERRNTFIDKSVLFVYPLVAGMQQLRMFLRSTLRGFILTALRVLKLTIPYKMKDNG